MSSNINYMELPKILDYNQSGQKNLNISEEIKEINKNKKNKKLLNYTTTLDSNILHNASIVTDAATNCSTEDIIGYRKRINNLLKEKKKQYFKEKVHKQKNSEQNFYTDFIRNKFYNKNISLTFSNFNKDDLSNIDNEQNNDNSINKSKINSEIINYNNNENKIYNKLIYLPNLYSQYKINYGSLTKTRQNLLDFNNTTKLIRLNNIFNKNLNYIYLTNVENIEIANSYCDFMTFKSNYKLLLLNKFIQSLDNYIKYLKSKIDNESITLSKLSYFRIQLRRKKHELITLCEKLIYEKKELCKYKVLLFLIKFDCSNFNELKDKSVLEKYGFNYIPNEYFYNNSFNYYDDRNDNCNKNYIKIYNPEIFSNLNEYENCFKLRENRILNLLIKKLKTEFDIPHLNANLDEIKNSIKKSFLFFKNEFENEKEKLRIVVNENNYLNEYLNNVNELYQKVNEFSQLKFLRKKLKFVVNQSFFKKFLKENLNIDLDKNQKKFVFNYNKNIISNIITNLNYLEKIINYLVDKDKKLKEKFPEKYLKAKNKINEIKGVIKNKKFIEEMLLNQEKQIKRIFEKNNKIIFKKVHRIEDNLRFSNINPNNHKKTKKYKIVTKNNVNEYEQFILY